LTVLDSGEVYFPLDSEDSARCKPCAVEINVRSDDIEDHGRWIRHQDDKAIGLGGRVSAGATDIDNPGAIDDSSAINT
jgi:hypothetical protein